jgi:hypothetical protein
MYWRDDFIGYIHQKITDVGGIVGIWEPSDSIACDAFRTLTADFELRRIAATPQLGTRVILRRSESSRAGHCLVESVGKGRIVKEGCEIILQRYIIKSHSQWLIENVR